MKVLTINNTDVYVKEEHQRTILYGVWHNAILKPKTVTIPRCFFIQREKNLFFGHLKDNTCYRIGTNYQPAHPFLVCMAKFPNIQDSINHFWNSAFYETFPLMMMTFGVSLQELTLNKPVFEN